MKPESPERIKRIIVALDASPESLQALDAAVSLAIRLKAELAGLFVEDQNLWNTAHLPFAQEVSAFSGKPQKLDPTSLQRRFTHLARQARQALAQRAQEARLTWSFRVVREQVVSALMNAAQEHDLISLGKASWNIGPTLLRMGSTAHNLLREGQGSILFGSYLTPAASEQERRATPPPQGSWSLAQPKSEQDRRATPPPQGSWPGQIRSEQERRMTPAPQGRWAPDQSDAEQIWKDLSALQESLPHLPPHPDVYVFCETIEDEDSLLRKATAFLEPHATLHVLLPAQHPTTMKKLQERAEQWLQSHHITAQFHPLWREQWPDLEAWIQQQGGGMLLLSGHSPRLNAPDFLKHILRMKIPILLVR